jgi:hypothetical protein
MPAISCVVDSLRFPDQRGVEGLVWGWLTWGLLSNILRLADEWTDTRLFDL